MLAEGTGALSAPQVSKGITTSPQEYFAMRGDLASEGTGILSGAKQFGFEGLSKGAEAVSGVRDVIGPGGTPLGLNKASLGAVSLPLGQGTTDLAMATARKALKDYEDELAAYELETGQAQTASDDARRTAIIAAMTAGQHSQDVIDETLNLLGLKDGGVVKMKDGGIMDLGGKEMDMRTGGFIPIGKRERADDVPARLSKNEFVMTADAVRAAGGGDVNEGAKRMYETMNRLEARA